MIDLPTVAEIQRKVAETAFGRPLVTNVLRGHVVEAIVAAALEPEWEWCAEDYSSWDLQRADGLRLEVKQSAARQSWATSDKPSACSFDIAERKGRWEGAVWIDSAGRAAHIYVLAHHPVADISADHREAAQWRFYVIPTDQLPLTRRLSLSRARALTNDVGFAELAAEVAGAAASLKPSAI
ncbi:hypothetical protein [Novosphingobium sp.]|uniref:hypothetical protein n=1 Tax=Novosphingobium sp. TaxID=1874826 RepID=UPI00260CCB48|nr:hypothetical protein [Novosphingobium sp.]